MIPANWEHNRKSAERVCGRLSDIVIQPPSCLISWTHSGPVGGRLAGEGRHGGMNMAGGIDSRTEHAAQDQLTASVGGRLTRAPLGAILRGPSRKRQPPNPRAISPCCVQARRETPARCRSTARDGLSKRWLPALPPAIAPSAA